MVARTYLRDLAERNSSGPLVHHVHQAKVKVELDVLLRVYGQAVVALKPSEAAGDGHHLSRHQQPINQSRSNIVTSNHVLRLLQQWTRQPIANQARSNKTKGEYKCRLSIKHQQADQERVRYRG